MKMEDVKVRVHNQRRRRIAFEKEIPNLFEQRRCSVLGRSSPTRLLQPLTRRWQERTSRRRLRREDIMRWVFTSEEVSAVGRRFHFPQHEKAGRFQCMVKAGNDSPLERGFEVVKDVLAAYQIYIGEGWILREVVAAENTDLSHPSRHLISIFMLDEEPDAAITGDILERQLRV